MSLYHYTDAAAVMSIIEKQELWLTDIRFLNDSEEAIDGAKHIAKEISKLEKFNEPSFDQALEHLRDFTVDSAITDLDDMHMFLCSFSQTKDHLSQWRSYGAYAIEFDDQLIGELAPLSNCIYDPFFKSLKAKELVDRIRENIATDLNKSDPLAYFDAMQHVWALGDAISLFKHQSFSEESEVRIIKQESSLSDEIYYRARGEYLIPYTKLKIPIESIKAVHIGPMKHQNLAASSMRSFVGNIYAHNKGSQYQGERGIAVIQSAIPYRSI